MNHNPSNDPLFALILGATGNGKTVYMRHRIPELNRRFHRVVIIDPFGQYADDFKTKLVLVPKLLEFLQSGESGVCCVRGRNEADIVYAGLSCWRYGNVCIVFDEFHRSGNSSEFIHPVWSRICMEGRSFAIRLIGITQRPTLIPKITQTNLTDLVAFKTTMKNDVNWIQSIIGPSAVELPNKRKFQAIYWGSNPDIFVSKKGG